MNNSFTRRHFGRTLLAASSAVTVVPAFLRGQNLNSKLNIAIIGCGGAVAPTWGASPPKTSWLFAM